MSFSMLLCAVFCSFFLCSLRWYHVTVTYLSNSQHGYSTRTLYQNGEAVASDAPGFDLQLSPSNTHLMLGCGPNAANNAVGACLAGGLDEFRLFTRALPASEVSTGYLTNIYSTGNLEVYY